MQNLVNIEEVALRRAVRALRAVTECNHILVHASDELGLLNDICRIVIEQGGYRFAWVGFTQHDEKKTIMPVAKAGFEQGYLSAVNVTWADEETGRGPIGTAIRSGKPCIVRDTLHHDAFRLWRSEAVTRGYASVIALPLIIDSNIIGSINIYAAEQNAFDEDEVKLLLELANDLSFGIKSLRMQSEKERAEEKLQKSELYYRSIIENSQDLICVLNVDGIIRYISPSIKTTLGYEPEELIGTNIVKLMHPEDKRKAIEQFLAGVPMPGFTSIIEHRFKHKDGSWRFFEAKGKNLIDKEGITGVVYHYRDTTDRKSAEEMLKKEMVTINTMYEIDQAILSTLKPQRILYSILMKVNSLVPCDAEGITLIDKERGGFTLVAGFGIPLFTKDLLVRFSDTSMTDVVMTGKQQYISDLSSTTDSLLLENIFMGLGFVSVIRIPLKIKNEIIGVMNFVSKKPAAFDKDIIVVLEKLVAQISVAFSNIRLVSDLEELSIGAIKALSNAIDAKSKWTAGHSERVTQYAVAIGKAMGLEENALQELEIAGLLHDIGKIGTYENILDKKEELSEENIKLIRQHPVKGAEILSPIRQLKYVIPAVKHHHERYDGTGYPDGLKGDAIPFTARILAVADAVDAMASDRPYRKGKPKDEIIAELERSSDSQLDPYIVKVFLLLDMLK